MMLNIRSIKTSSYRWRRNEDWSILVLMMCCLKCLLSNLLPNCDHLTDWNVFFLRECERKGWTHIWTVLLPPPADALQLVRFCSFCFLILMNEPLLMFLLFHFLLVCLSASPSWKPFNTFCILCIKSLNCLHSASGVYIYSLNIHLKQRFSIFCNLRPI